MAHVIHALAAPLELRPPCWWAQQLQRTRTHLAQEATLIRLNIAEFWIKRRHFRSPELARRHQSRMTASYWGG